MAGGVVRRPGLQVEGMEEARERITRPRMIVSVGGEEKEGKSQFALTAPDPIGCIPLDTNSDELIQKWRVGKKIMVPNPDMSFSEAKKTGEWKALFERLTNMWDAMIASPYIRSIVVDTFTDVYELARMATFGKLTEVPPHFYGKVNLALADMIKALHKTDKNLVLVHRLKDQYKGNSRTGERIVDGYAAVGYRVQLNVVCWRDVGRREVGEDGEVITQGFGLTVKNCTQNEKLANTFLEEPYNTWTELGKLVYPGTTDADWE